VWPACHMTLADQPCVGAIPKIVLSTCPVEAVLKVSNAQRRCKEETSGSHMPNLQLQHHITPPINTTVLPPTESVKRVRFSPLECSQVHSCGVEIEARF
jgi:hypothetical protein